MTSATNPPTDETSLSKHTQLPEAERNFIKHFQKYTQSFLLTDSISQVLRKRHSDRQYFTGQHCPVYWRCDPPERDAVIPSWFYVPNVPPMLNGHIRQFYMLWQESITPLIILEFVSGNGTAERDKTPRKGKFWIYEQVLNSAFYGIYEVNKASIEVYELIHGQYQLLSPNKRGHYALTMGLELGIWQGEYQNIELPWLRWWDEQGNLLLTGEERADRLAAQLQALGVDPEV
ncbi:Uma2 family endonuclease [Nostoc linckia FACHB-104]|nr:Uma2 family endonuclease [Nostoc linckia FACHB-104]